MIRNSSATINNTFKQLIFNIHKKVCFFFCMKHVLLILLRVQFIALHFLRLYCKGIPIDHETFYLLQCHLSCKCSLGSVFTKSQEKNVTSQTYIQLDYSSGSMSILNLFITNIITLFTCRIIV